jgi:hypothetical protein
MDDPRQPGGGIDKGVGCCHLCNRIHIRIQCVYRISSSVHHIQLWLL